MKQHEVHRLPMGAFSGIAGARKRPPEQPQPGFQRHLVGQETPLERRFRVPVMSVPQPADAPAPGPGRKDDDALERP